MFLKIKNKIEKELRCYIKNFDRLYSLSAISPALFSSIREFLCRKGKRIRPALFVLGYLGFAQKPALGLYKSAVSLELLHAFLLVHDDIIDKSATRRGKPSMHQIFNRYLAGRKNLKFNGQDLTIVAGDVMFAMALEAFLAVKENLRHKEAALRRLIEAALYTGSGEFLELLSGTIDIANITKEKIYKIYDLKTANYTFCAPLTIGAVLAGAGKKEADKLFKYGTYLGRAFQIKDDIVGIYGQESEIGKPNITDLKEGKKTLLVWQAYRNAGSVDKKAIRDILSKNSAGYADLLKMRRIMRETRALDMANKEIADLTLKAENILKSSRMKARYKNALNSYARKLLNTNPSYDATSSQPLYYPRAFRTGLVVGVAQRAAFFPAINSGS
jgi:geranylgeranyl diphosphate synthase type I